LQEATGEGGWLSRYSPRGAGDRGRRGSRADPLTLEVATKLEGVKRLVERVEFVAGLGGENADGAEAVVGGLGPVVDSVGARALASLRHELLDRLEEVDVQAGQAVDALQLRIGGSGREAIIADELADARAVLLFDMGTVVLFPRAAAREGDVLEATIGQERPVDELGAIVAVEPDERDGQARPDAVDGAADPLLPLAPDGFQFDPGRRDIDGAEGAE